MAASHCIFWPIRTLNWLVAASKLHDDGAPFCTATWPVALLPMRDSLTSDLSRVHLMVNFLICASIKR